MKTPSIRLQLIRGMTVLFSLMIIGLVTAIYFAVKKESYREFDQSLVQRAQMLSFMVEVENNQRVFEWEELGLEHPPEFDIKNEEYAIWSASGQVLAASPNGAKLPRFSGQNGEPVIRVAHNAAKEPVKLAGLSVIPHFNETDVVSADLKTPVEVVFSHRDLIRQQMVKTSRILFITALCGLILTAIFVTQLVNRLLHPLAELRQKVSLVETSEGLQKIHFPEAPAELNPVVAELNELLERVEDGLERERLMTSNVAHELRTPLAAMQANLELALSRQRSVSEHEKFSRDAMDVVQHMNRLMADLLSFSRLSAKQMEIKSETIDLAKKLPLWAAPFQVRAHERGMNFLFEAPSLSQINSDENLLRIVINNLLDNALSHADVGSEILFQIEKPGRLTIANQVKNLHPDFARHAFDPYWRASSSRHDTAGHSGLGLSICQKIMQALGGEIKFEYEVDRLKAVLTFQDTDEIPAL